MNTGEAAVIMCGRLEGSAVNEITDLLTDSRSSTFDSGGLFFAIRGASHDGHDYILQLAAKGVKSFVAERLPDGYRDCQGCSFIMVDDTVEALQRLGAARRKGSGCRVIAVTGSAGKTIVKEWLAAVLGRRHSVVRSPRSYNSQVGVPLSLWKIEKEHEYAVIEAGISQPGEMEKLQQIILPDIGIVTNIGDAHGENFRDRQHKAAEKMKLFSGVGHLVYPADCAEIVSEVERIFNGSSTSLASWTLSGGEACFRAVAERDKAHPGTVITIEHKAGILRYQIPFGDRASVENSVSVAVAALVAGLDAETIASGLANISQVAMRMSVKNGNNGCMLIEDYYNSDPGSLAMAVDYLKSLPAKKHTLILSDFIQTGRDHSELAPEIDALLKRGGVSRLIGIGPGLSANAGAFSCEKRFYNSTSEFIAAFQGLSFSNEVILLKGARSFGFERIAPLLERKIHTTVLEINLDAIAGNISLIRSALKPGVRLMGMVKAFAYGSGLSEMGSFLEYNRADYLGVAYADEGRELREAGITLPVMVMNPEESAFDTIIAFNLEPEIYSFSLLEAFSAAAARHGLSGWPVHIKTDTGMHRLGFVPDEAEQLAERLRGDAGIRVVSLFSHLAASESEAADGRTERQAEVFEKVSAIIAGALGYMPLRHLLNSSGIARFPQYQYDMVRAGIGLYGLSDSVVKGMRNSSRFVSRISQVKRVPAGEPVGYGFGDVAGHDRLIATIPVGYADGLRRAMGNGKGFVWVRGARVPTAGNICMDMFMADVTGTGAAEGDVAEIFGDNIPVREMAASCGTIPYEIISSIPPRVRRIFYRE